MQKDQKAASDQCVRAFMKGQATKITKKVVEAGPSRIK